MLLPKKAENALGMTKDKMQAGTYTADHVVAEGGAYKMDILDEKGLPTIPARVSVPSAELHLH